MADHLLTASQTALPDSSGHTEHGSRQGSEHAGTTGRSSVTASGQSKHRALTKLNNETRPLHAALNQTQIALAHVMRLFQKDYEQKRTQIINGHDYD